MFKPVPRTGHTKYGGTNPAQDMMFQEIDIPEHTREILTTLGCFGLAKSTWSSYNTAARMLAKCFSEEKRRLEMPLGTADILIFISWLAHKRKVKAGTIESYLAGVRQLHLMKGMEPPIARSGIVKWILKGKRNEEQIQDRKKLTASRLPMTPGLMKLLKVKLVTWEETNMKKLLIWAVATLAFNGAFRIHELLCRQEASFDPDFELLREDVTTKQTGGKKTIEVKLKCPKENRNGQCTIVKVYETEGTLCPVKAFDRWNRMTKTKEDKTPLFREEDGTPLTGKKLNKVLKTLLEDNIDYKIGKIQTHSFRIGLASTLGARGFSEEEIKKAGRWKSGAYETYTRLPRTDRDKVARKISLL